MKIIRTLLAGVFALFAFQSCGQAEGSAAMRATILQADGSSAIIAANDEQDAATADLYSFSTKGVELLGIDGGKIQPEELSAGQIVEVVHKGYIRESYPAGIDCTKLAVTGAQPEDWQNPIDQYMPPAEADPNSPYAMMPSLGIEYSQGETVSFTYAARGTSDWYENGEGVAVDSALPGSEKAWELVPEITRQKGYNAMTLNFSREPDSFTVTCWSDTQLTEEAEIQLDGKTLSFPKKSGTYYCEILAQWPEGNVSYYFILK